MAKHPQLEGLDPLQLELLRRRLQSSKKKRPRPKVEPIPRLPEAEDYPLSFAQQRLWFFDQWAPGQATFNIPAAVRMAGPLNLALLGRAFDEVVRRHESLRTTLLHKDDGPAQRVAPPAPVHWTLVDLAELDPETRRRQSDRLASAAARRPFDLEHGPLLRLSVQRLAPREHLLVLVVHHIVSDAWSTEILVGEIVTLYQAWLAGRPSPLPELPIQYRDYAVWQRRQLAAEGESVRRQLDYWRQQLDGAPPLVEVPTDRPRSATQSFRGDRIEIHWGAERVAGIRRLAKAVEATPFVALLSVFAVLLRRYTGQDDLVTGTLVAHRTRKEIEGLIGFFANTLVLRTDLASATTFGEVAGVARHTALDAFAHQDLPFEKLVEELNPDRALGHNPLFQMMFVLLDDVRRGFELDTLEIESREIGKGVANFDLYFSVMLGQASASGWLDYNVDLYDRSTAERVFAHFENLLDAAIAQPGARLDRLPMLSTAERRQMVAGWNATAVDYPEATTVLDLFDVQVARDPGAVALVFEGETLSYGELARRSMALATTLRHRGCGPETVVGILMERSFEMVVALYAVLRAGAAYLPLDPEQPVERLRRIVDGAGSPWILTQGRFRELAAELGAGGVGVSVLEVDAEALENAEGTSGAGAMETPSILDRDGLAYVIYTSGSTGRPKGVMNVHGALLNRLQWMQGAFPLGADDAVLQKTPFTFDVSVWEFFWPLMTGARLVIARPGGHRDGAYLARLIGEQQITTLHFVPSMLQLFLSEEALDCGSLRRIISSGEALGGELVAQAHHRLGAEVHNLYGPTEAAIDVSWWPVPRAEEPAVIPIGRPIANLRLHILDRALRPVPVGAAGELMIGGVGLARGYRAGPALTAGAFVPDPLASESGAPAGSRLYRTGDLARYRADGTIEYLGRLDHQVKLRGLRIELGEIETHLEAHPAVARAVVVVREDMADDQRLVAYLVPAADADSRDADSEDAGVADSASIDTTVLDQALRRQLPDYMVPSAWVVLETLPTTGSGKVDRKALPRPSSERSLEDEAKPRTPDEERLARTFAEVLGVEAVGIHDNFFQLGGHSLLATQLVSRLRDHFELEWTLPEFFATPTVAGLAQRIHLEVVEAIEGDDLAEMMALLEGMSDEDVAAALQEG